MEMPGPSSPAFLVTAAPGFSSLSPSLDYSNLDCSEEDLLSLSSEAEKVCGRREAMWTVLGITCFELLGLCD